MLWHPVFRQTQLWYGDGNGFGKMVYGNVMLCFVALHVIMRKCIACINLIFLFTYYLI